MTLRPAALLSLTVLFACGAPLTNDGGVDAGLDAGLDAGVDCNTTAQESLDVVFTEQGPVRGALDGDGARAFLGIPFAKPPVGALRWRPPERDTACWPAVRDATQWAPTCPQLEQGAGAFDAGAPFHGQEDCLTLNVFTPPGMTADAGLPVMVFIHGGGNTMGSASELAGSSTAHLYDGRTLATRGGVVVVTLEYRLGVLGFLALAQLDAESDAGVSGNYGLMDQQLALAWVQRNVGRFGGDASRVLLFGESAGAVDTCMHLAAPASRGLFHRAAIESGSCATQPLAEKRAEGVTWLAAGTCAGASDVPTCLRALTPEQLVRAYPVPVNVGARKPEVSWGPNVDGVVLPQAPLQALGASDVPLIVGHNTDETNLTMPFITTEAEYRAAVVGLVGPVVADQVLARYPVATYGTPRKALVQVTTDAFFGCQARLTSRAHTAAPTYRYLFSRAPVAVRGAFHGVELAYVFQRVAALTSTPAAEDLATEAHLLGYWSRFAASGDPNGAGAVSWARVGAGDPLVKLDAVVSQVSGWRNAECDFFDALAP